MFFCAIHNNRLTHHRGTDGGPLCGSVCYSTTLNGSITNNSMGRKGLLSKDDFSIRNHISTNSWSVKREGRLMICPERYVLGK